MVPSEDGQQAEQEREVSAGAAAHSPSARWRWAIGAVIVVALLYPLARRWMVSGNSAAGAPVPPAVQPILNTSFQLYQAGRYQEAITTAKKALEMDPNSADAYNNLAVSYLGLRMYDEAIQSAQQAIRIRPDYQLAKNNLNWILSEKAGKPPAAVKPDTPEYYLNQSLALYQSNQLPESIAAAREALKLRPIYAEAYNNIAAACAKMGQWDDAIQNAQQALRILPDFQLAKNNLAWALAEKNKSGK